MIEVHLVVLRPAERILHKPVFVRIEHAADEKLRIDGVVRDGIAREDEAQRAEDRLGSRQLVAAAPRVMRAAHREEVLRHPGTQSQHTYSYKKPRPVS